jgi:hypothetical protein
MLPESAAAGSLVGSLPQSSQRTQRWWLKMRSLGRNLKERSLVISHWTLGRGVGEMMRYGGMGARLLGGFLIVNYQLSIVKY